MRYLVASFFLLFAIVQYNDPDWYIWIPIYLLVSMVILFGRQYTSIKVINALIGIYFIGSLAYLPKMFSWVKNGMPSIIESMKAESPYIEFCREFFGLILCIFGLLYAKKITKKIK
jgi:hypothetical protein